MNVQRVSRRLVQPGTPRSLASVPTAFPVLPFRPASQCQRRHASSNWVGFQSNKSNAPSSADAQRGKVSNPLLDDYLQKKPALQQAQRLPKRGSLSRGSIFEQDEKAQPEEAELAGDRDDAGAGGSSAERNLDAMATTLDPRPNARRRWEARMVMCEVRRRGRMSRTQVIRQIERSHTNTSPMMKTSVKKLGMLARQIAGKTLDDAMTQMRFSSKKMARGVLAHLQYASDSAVVRNGMALGAVDGDTRETVTIRDKEGNRIKVTDPTKMYIDEAWVNRGTYRRKPEYRARGRTNVLRLPYTSLTVVLKEEATRVRQHQEREEREAKRKVWVPMPDRPVTAQHQYPLW